MKQEVVTVGCDNNSALCLAKYQVYHERSNHIDVRLRLRIEKEEVKVFKVPKVENPANMLAKSLPNEKFQLCIRLVNLCML